MKSVDLDQLVPGSEAVPLPPGVHEAWSRVMARVQSIGKDGTNEMQGYKFRGVDATVNAVGPALREESVSVVPVETTYWDERFTTKKGSEMRGVTVQIRFRVYGPRGDYFDGQALGESADSGDKAVPKAHSVAYRTFLLQSLCIPTGDPDPDSESHERVAEPQRETPKPGDTITPEKLAEVEAFAKRAGFNFWAVATEVLGSGLTPLPDVDAYEITNEQAKTVCQEISNRKKARA